MQLQKCGGNMGILNRSFMKKLLIYTERSNLAILDLCYNSSSCMFLAFCFSFTLCVFSDKYPNGQWRQRFIEEIDNRDHVFCMFYLLYF